MRTSHFLFFLLLISSGLFVSCSTEEEPIVPEPEMEMEEMEQEPDDSLPDAPSFTMQTTEGASISSAEFEGKNLVIFFFGWGCPPCRAVGPDIEEKLHQRFKDNDNFAIIGGDQWEGNNAGVNDFQSTTGITFPLGTQAADVARAFETTYDRLVVVNAAGKIVYKGNSIASNNLDDVVELMEDLLQ